MLQLRFIYGCFILLSIVSCKQDVKETPIKTGAVVYGQIANPKHSDVTIFKPNNITDTLILNDNRKFHISFDTVYNNFYLLKHFSESQIFFLEEGDNLGIHLNTEAFDESLTFTGHGSEKNNYLIGRFLFNEKHQHLFTESLSSSQEDYINLADSIYQLKKNELYRQQSKFNFSDNFMAFAKTTMRYEHYFRLEEYIHYSITNGGSINNTPITKHRDSINPNISKLSKHYNYFRTLELYLRNLAIEDCLGSNSITFCTNEYSLFNLQRKQRLADSILKNIDVRSNILNRLNTQLLLASNTKLEIDNNLVRIQETKPSIKILNDYVDLAVLKRELLPGKTIDFEVVTRSGNTTGLINLLTTKNVLFFWDNTYSQRHIIQHIRISRLQKTFPNLKFIGINLNKTQEKQWRTSLNNYSYDSFSEVQLSKDMEYDESVYKNLSHAVFFVDKDGKVISSNLFLFASNIERDLMHYSNQ